MKINHVYCGDSRELIKEIEDKSVNCIITSPPYYALRDYGMSEQMGLEKTPEEYIAGMVALFRDCRRVLRDDGTLWVNIGDSYAASGRGGGGGSFQDKDLGRKVGDDNNRRKPPSGYKQKDLIGIPWMLAFALRADGWYLRQDIIWSKPNPMPESVQDRCTKAHEYIFMLSKSQRYYYDAEAIRTPAKESSLQRWDQDVPAQNGSARVPGKTNGNMKAVGGPMKALPEGQQNIRKARSKQRAYSRRDKNGINDRWDNMTTEEQMAMGANKRSVWEVATMPFKEAHFATFPEKLVVDMIKAGCPMDGLVLDIFFGAGTTGVVARKLQRNFIGFELNPKYVAIAEKRLSDELGMFR